MDLDELPTPPEDIAAFRIAQLLLVLDCVNGPVNLERIGYYDFFLSNPMLVGELTETDRTALVMAGFDSRTIDRHSAAQRFANRRQKIRSDLATLVAYGLARPQVQEGEVTYSLTSLGTASSQGLTGAHADALRRSAEILLPMIRKLSDRGLRRQASEWLRLQPGDIDLLGVDTSVEIGGSA